MREKEKEGGDIGRGDKGLRGALRGGSRSEADETADSQLGLKAPRYVRPHHPGHLIITRDKASPRSREVITCP